MDSDEQNKALAICMIAMAFECVAVMMACAGKTKQGFPYAVIAVAMLAYGAYKLRMSLRQ